MVSLVSLWLAILVSAVFVFIVSSVIHTVLTYHQADFKKIPEETRVMEALRQFDIPPGDYFMPHGGSAKAMSDPDFVARMEKGPVAVITFLPPGPPSMTGSLILWFLYCLIIGVFAAYVSGRALGPGAPYLEVFRLAGCTAFAGYSLALLQSSIWMKKSWVATFKSIFDGLIYALLTAGTFGWLWPN